MKYVRLPDLLLNLQAARNFCAFTSVLKKYTKPVLLIIDEWLLLKLTESEARNLFESIYKEKVIMKSGRLNTTYGEAEKRETKIYFYLFKVEINFSLQHYIYSLRLYF